MKKVGVKELQGDKQQIEGNLVLKKGKMYVPKDKALIVEIIWLHHDIPVARHGGRWKMTKLVIKNYQWLGVTRDVGKYVNRCDICQKMKNRTEALVEKLKLSKILIDI